MKMRSKMVKSTTMKMRSKMVKSTTMKKSIKIKKSTKLVQPNLDWVNTDLIKDNKINFNKLVKDVLYRCCKNTLSQKELSFIDDFIETEKCCLCNRDLTLERYVIEHKHEIRHLDSRFLRFFLVFRTFSMGFPLNPKKFPDPGRNLHISYHTAEP